MPSQTMPELMAQVDRIERQVARSSENLGIPYGLQEALEAIKAL